MLVFLSLLRVEGLLLLIIPRRSDLLLSYMPITITTPPSIPPRITAKILYTQLLNQVILVHAYTIYKGVALLVLIMRWFVINEMGN